MKQKSGMFPQQIDGLHGRQWSFELVTAGICDGSTGRTWCVSCVYTKIVSWMFLTVACARWEKLPSLWPQPSWNQKLVRRKAWILSELSGCQVCLWKVTSNSAELIFPLYKKSKNGSPAVFCWIPGLDLGGTAQPWELLRITCCPCMTSNGWLSTPRKRSRWRLFASPSSPAWTPVLPGVCMWVKLLRIFYNHNRFIQKDPAWV